MSDNLEQARQVADAVREQFPDKAAEIDRALADVAAGRRDGASIRVEVGFTLEKFDAGAWATGRARPYEVVEGRG